MIVNYKYVLKWSYIVWCGYQKISSHGIQAHLRKQFDICEMINFWVTILKFFGSKTLLMNVLENEFHPTAA